MNGKLLLWHKSAAAMSIVVLFDPITDFWISALFTDKAGAAVEEARDVKAVIDVCKELPPVDFCFFYDDVFDTAIKEAQSICHFSKLLAMVSFARFLEIEIADNLL